MARSSTLVLKGTYYYAAQEEYRRRRLKAGADVFLVHTPYNPYDKNAVAVHLLPSGSMLGHISKEVSARYADLVDWNQIGSATVKSVQKSDESNIRVEIFVSITERRVRGHNPVTGTGQIIPEHLHKIVLLERQRLEGEASHRNTVGIAEKNRPHFSAEGSVAENSAPNSKFGSPSTPKPVSSNPAVHRPTSSGNSNGFLIAGGAVGLLFGGPVGAIIGCIVGYFIKSARK